MRTFQELMAGASKARRVCPQPAIWNQLWELLPDRRRVGVGWQPSAPLILAAWWETSDSDKRSRFHSHLGWAYEYGVIEPVAALMLTMRPEEDWHTEH